MEWRNFFSLGIVHPQLFPETAKDEAAVSETLSILVKDSFFDAIEITTIKEPAVRERVKVLLGEHGIRTVYCCAPPILMHKINLNSLREKERIEYVEQIKGYLVEAIFMGAEIFTVLSGPDPGPARREAAKERLVASLKEICRFAAAKDHALTVTLESFDREIDKRCLIGPSDETLEIARKVIGSGLQNFGLTLDQGHLPLLGENPAYVISKTLPFLSHLHLGNCIRDYPDHPLYGDHHPRYGLTGCCLEQDDLVKFLHVLDNHGFWREKQHEGDKPIISFEVKPAPGESSLDTLQKVKETWCQAWEFFRQGEGPHCL